MSDDTSLNHLDAPYATPCELIQNEYAGLVLAAADQAAVIVVFDKSGRVLRANGQAERLLGAPKSIVGYAAKSLTLAPLPVPRILASLRGTGIWRGEVTIKAFDEREVSLDVTLLPVKDADGAFLAVGFDTSAHKMQIAGLRKRLAFKGALLENAPYPVVATSPEGIIAVFNRSAEKYYGYSAEEVIDKQTPGIFHDPSEIVARAEALSTELGRPVQPGFGVFTAKPLLDLPEVNEWTQIRKDGSRYPASVSVNVTRDKTNRVTGFLAVVIDLTEQKHRERVLANMREKAEAANQAKSAFLATMSHEIRTPMNGVLGTLELLDNSDLTETQRAHIRIARSSAKTLLALINDILDLSKLEADKVELEAIAFNLPELVEETVTLLAPEAAKKGLRASVEFDESMPPWLLGDPTRIRQVVFNLVGNAIKFTHEGSVTVRISSRFADEDQVRLRLEVRDTGVGIDPEHRSRLFKPFSQADTSTTRKFGGTGLGLAVSSQLVNRMGGKIGVEGRKGEGACFWIELTLPVSIAPLAAPAMAACVASTPLHILVAEDHPVNQMLAKAMLEIAGHTVDTVNNGLEAVEAVKTGGYDIVLMDVQMPEMDGPTATARIRAFEGPLAGIPIVAVTANAVAGDRERYLSMGMDDYVSKPVEAALLFAAVERMRSRTLRELGEEAA